MNKIAYQSIQTDFEATQEAELLLLTDRIMVEDNTRPNRQDGDVISQDGLNLVLSQPVTLTGNDVIYLQHIDGTVELIPISSGAGNSIVLQSPPKMALATDETLSARSGYIIVTG